LCEFEVESTLAQYEASDIDEADLEVQTVTERYDHRSLLSTSISCYGKKSPMSDKATLGSSNSCLGDFSFEDGEED